LIAVYSYRYFLYNKAFWYKFCIKKVIVQEVIVDETTPLVRSQSASSFCIFALGLMYSKQPSNNFIILGNHIELDYSYQIGRVLAWTCTALYLSSRIPQIYLNYTRKTCQGLAIVMFLCALVGNVTYAASVLVKSNDPQYLLGALPYLLGTMGTVMFDVTIFCQWFFYPSTSAITS
jgi:hypothetical protein